jgi:ADP-L-glycero-D-manno-heptose 6-epimerase
LRDQEKAFASLNSQLTTLNCLHLLPAFTACIRKTIGSWEVVSSHSSATAPESHGNSSHRSTDQTHKELPPEVAGRIRTLKIYFGRNGGKLQGEAIFNRLLLRSAVANRRSLKHKVLALVGSGFIYQERAYRASTVSSPLNSILVTGGAGFIGSNLVLALQERMPEARLTVIDDFRSGDFKNLAGYRGDFVAQNLAALDWREQFGDEKFDAIFHLASITDTTLHDQFVQVHDNVESFRRLLNFARPNRTRVIYASSAATYGAASTASAETNGAAPANVYAFSKAIMDNIANRAAQESKDWIIIGLRYFNVYGPREAHKGVPASMVYHLSRQMKSGQRPRIFKHGDQKRDFVYVKDIVEGSIGALEGKQSGIYNLGSGRARSFNELVDVLNRSLATDFKPDYIENPHAHYQNFTQADLTQVRSSLGYEPKYPLETGVADYMRWLYPA